MILSTNISTLTKKASPLKKNRRVPWVTLAKSNWSTGPTIPQWHINIPNALAKALNLQKGEDVEWEIESRTLLVLIRKTPPKSKILKTGTPPSVKMK